LVHPQDLIQLQSNLIDPLMTGELQKLTGQMRFRKKDGSYIWVESIIQPLMKDGLMDSILSVSRDVSEWKNAEFEMSKALEKEKDLNELKSRFITMASHEFRTPLTSIKSSVQLLEMYADEVGSDLSQPLYKHMAKISTQIDRLTDLMEDILIVGKTEADKMPFEEEPTDLVEFTESILETELPVNEVNRSAKLTIHGDPYNVKIDQGLMGHVLSNTLSNAFKYSPGAAPPEVDLFFESNYFEITVTDFGMGIPQEQRHQLFESFFRADNAVDIQGTGLGLVITKQFIELHGGTIRIESQLNQGTKVIMRFPLSR
jgi:signal transduction histidine kinase